MYILKYDQLIKYLLGLILIIILILSLLNYRKFRTQEEELVRVFFPETRIDRHHIREETSVFKRLQNRLQLENILSRIYNLRLEVPITYLQQEIPLLRFYTPPDLREPGARIYSRENSNRDQVMRLTFDLREEEYMSEEETSAEEKREEVADRPTIALYHSHTSETYIDDVRSNHRGNVSPGEIGNVAQVASHLADNLVQNYNFNVIHTTEVHDEVYRRSYYNSRQTVKNLLDTQDEIDILFDIHRDGVEVEGRETYTTEINGKKVARIMIIVTNGRFDFAHLDIGDHHHVEWNHNLRFAEELAHNIQQKYPNLLMDLRVRDTTYNQDLHPQSLLLEIGDYENTTEEALRSAELLAEVLGEMY